MPGSGLKNKHDARLPATGFVKSRSGWRPASGPGVAARRAELLGRARAWFAEQDILQVDTPAIGATSVTDPNIDSFQLASGDWLQTSPEAFMKRLLADGYPDIYSICRVFRDGESGRRHLREFTMIEWYRHGFGLADIVEDTCRLIRSLLVGRTGAFETVTLDYAEAFHRHLDIDPITSSVAELRQAARADAQLVESLGDDRDAWLDLLMATAVAPCFPAGQLTVVEHYPASQAALARLCPVDPGVADRFEVFAGDLELANGYVELTDAQSQSARMDKDRNVRRHAGRPDVPADTHLLAALEHGLPACAGVALGFERVHMLADGAGHIDNVVTFR